MKKTSLIFLTLVATCSVTFCAAQDESLKNQYPPEFLLETERLKAAGGDTMRRDTVRRDTTVVMPAPPVQISYNYYYHNRFWDGWFRFWRPYHYYYLVHQPGFVPRRVRHSDGPSSPKRGGFGHTGGPYVHGTRQHGGTPVHSSGRHSWGGRSSSHSSGS